MNPEFQDPIGLCKIDLLYGVLDVRFGVRLVRQLTRRFLLRVVKTLWPVAPFRLPSSSFLIVIDLILIVSSSVLEAEKQGCS